MKLLPQPHNNARVLEQQSQLNITTSGFVSASLSGLELIQEGKHTIIHAYSCVENNGERGRAQSGSNGIIIQLGTKVSGLGL